MNLELNGSIKLTFSDSPPAVGLGFGSRLLWLLSLPLFRVCLLAAAPGALAQVELTIEPPLKLTLDGTPGTYTVEYSAALGDTADWRPLRIVTLSEEPLVVYDGDAPNPVSTYFRAEACSDCTDVPVNPDPSRLVWIPPGSFIMGSPSNEAGRSDWEGPQTLVTITQGFWMGKYEVTQAEFVAVMGWNPSLYGGDSLPVSFVGWQEAMSYCELLTQGERAAGRIPAGSTYRLPTEAEWEYACRAGTTTQFSYGDDPGYTNLSQYAWYAGNSGGSPHPVGRKLPNLWGLYDMHGNVPEWCSDWWDWSLPGGILADPLGPDSGEDYVIRSGDYLLGGAYARSASRYGSSNPVNSDSDIGFRVVLTSGE